MVRPWCGSRKWKCTWVISTGLMCEYPDMIVWKLAVKQSDSPSMTSATGNLYRNDAPANYRREFLRAPFLLFSLTWATITTHLLDSNQVRGCPEWNWSMNNAWRRLWRIVRHSGNLAITRLKKIPMWLWFQDINCDLCCIVLNFFQCTLIGHHKFLKQDSVKYTNCKQFRCQSIK